MIPEHILQHSRRVYQVLTEDLIEGGDGAAEVFGNEVGGVPESREVRASESAEADWRRES